MSEWIKEPTPAKDVGVCAACRKGKNHFDETCTYCNGTGEWNQAAQSYIKNHICQCILLDRRWCPACNEPCHHDSSCTPKCVIDSGYGGDVNYNINHTTNPGPAEKNEIEEEMVIV